MLTLQINMDIYLFWTLVAACASLLGMVIVLLVNYSRKGNTPPTTTPRLQRDFNKTDDLDHPTAGHTTKLTRDAAPVQTAGTVEFEVEYDISYIHTQETVD